MLLLAILLLLVAVGLLAAVVVTGQIALAWASVGVSALVALVLVVRQRSVRRGRDSGAESDLAQSAAARPESARPARPEAAQPADAESADAESADPTAAEPGTAASEAGSEATAAETAGSETVGSEAVAAEATGSEGAGSETVAAESGGAESAEAEPADSVSPTEDESGAGAKVGVLDVADDPATEAQSAEPAPPTGARGDPPAADRPDDAEPDEEDTDAADHLLVWEMPDEVLVVDEHPRYHLAGCSWPDAAHTEAISVREARELGFTPCGECRPDRTLARRHRASRVAAHDS
jgi:hypothetical protein